MVSVFGFDNKFYVFINLFLLDIGGNGLNQVTAGEDFVQYSVAEDTVPAAGAAGGNTADYYFFITAVLAGSLGRGSLAGAGSAQLFFHWCSRTGYPVYKSGVISGMVPIHIGSSPI